VSRLSRQQLGRGTLRPIQSGDRAGNGADCVARLVDAQHPSAAKLVADLEKKTLVDPTKDAMGFPSGVPGIPDSISCRRTSFSLCSITTGVRVRSQRRVGQPDQRPAADQARIAIEGCREWMWTGTVGRVPTTQRDAPLGTYLGWNITAGSGLNSMETLSRRPGVQLHRWHGAIFQTKAQRLAAGDPRLSLEERYGTQPATCCSNCRCETTHLSRVICSQQTVTP